METAINDLISRSGLTPQTLTGQTAVVTGADRGIGREMFGLTAFACLALGLLGVHFLSARRTGEMAVS